MTTGISLGFSSYSFHSKLSTGEMTLPEVIEWVAASEGEHLELAVLSDAADSPIPNITSDPAYVEEIRERPQRAGVTLSTLAIGANFLTDDPRELATQISAREEVRGSRRDPRDPPDAPRRGGPRRRRRGRHPAVRDGAALDRRGQQGDRAVRRAQGHHHEPREPRLLRAGRRTACAGSSTPWTSRTSAPRSTSATSSASTRRPRCPSNRTCRTRWSCISRTSTSVRPTPIPARAGSAAAAASICAVRSSATATSTSRRSPAPSGPPATPGYASIEFEGWEDCLLGCERGIANARRLLETA